jgi:hypothetical protein
MHGCKTRGQAVFSLQLCGNCADCAALCSEASRPENVFVLVMHGSHKGPFVTACSCAAVCRVTPRLPRVLCCSCTALRKGPTPTTRTFRAWQMQGFWWWHLYHLLASPQEPNRCPHSVHVHVAHVHIMSR